MTCQIWRFKFHAPLFLGGVIDFDWNLQKGDRKLDLKLVQEMMRDKKDGQKDG